MLKDRGLSKLRNTILVAAIAGLLFPVIGRSDLSFFQALEKRLIRIPGGIFMMGSREAGEPPREVAVRSFWMGRTEVTANEFAAFRPPDHMTATNRPVARVTRADAEEYCRWLSEKLGRRVRLPTEEEWEYAARGGIHGARFPWGWGQPEGRACFNASTACAVASFEPNRYGLFDMAGNLAEWCAGVDEERAVVRGGSWADRDPGFLRVFARVALPPGYRDADVGFRIVVEADEEDPN
jgi:formylglycine-generating enzyme required for sulfatase activity